MCACVKKQGRITDTGSSTISGAERRATIQLLAGWIESKGTKPLPSLEGIEPLIGDGLRDRSFTIHVANPPMYSDVAFFGAQLVQTFQSDCTAFQVGEALDNFLLSSTIDFYHTVITRRAPVSEASRFIIGGKEARYRSLVVPLSTDGNTIDYLIGTANFRIFD